MNVRIVPKAISVIVTEVINMNDIKVFENSEFGKLEVLWENGKAYFPAKRCAEILGYSNPLEAVRRHCKGCVKRSLLTNGGKQEKNLFQKGIYIV